VSRRCEESEHEGERRRCAPGREGLMGSLLRSPGDFSNAGDRSPRVRHVAGAGRNSGGNWMTIITRDIFIYNRKLKSSSG
jgi:hypothetical protein